MQRCPHCAAELTSPLACAACLALLDVPDDATPFALLGLEPAFAQDLPALRKRLARQSRLVHPDFFGGAAPEVRARAEQASARLNRAFEIVSDDVERAHWLVEALGGPGETQERSMPQAFLLEVLEWNELLEEARGGNATPEQDARVLALERDLVERRAQSLRTLAALLTPLPAHGAPALRSARQELNAVRYLDRALAGIEAQRLARSASR